jgi:D-arabinose 1-dehydrogenase-like Zn-dependent alcohol dehydrogenase
MGANVTAISHTASKKADAEKMGATRFIATADGDHVFKENARSLDLIIATTNDHKMPLQGYMQLLKPHGYLVFVRSVARPGQGLMLTCPHPGRRAGGAAAADGRLPTHHGQRAPDGQLDRQSRGHPGDARAGRDAEYQVVDHRTAHGLVCVLNPTSYARMLTERCSINEVHADMEDGKARYRYVLVNDKHKHLGQ